MKKNFNLKLTLSLVSLFVSLLLIILGNKNTYCLSFGFILLGIALAIYAMNKAEQIDSAIIEVANEIEETPIENVFAQQELAIEMKKYKKQKSKLNVTFYLCAVLLVIVGITFMF